MMNFIKNMHSNRSKLSMSDIDDFIDYCLLNNRNTIEMANIIVDWAIETKPTTENQVLLARRLLKFKKYIKNYSVLCDNAYKFKKEMKMSKVFAFDVDNTIVDSGKVFSDWVVKEKWYMEYFDNEENAKYLAYSAYSLSNYNFFHNKHKKIMQDWWKSADLYNDMSITPQAESIINKLVNDGNKVIFVSHVEGNHAKSKFDMISRHFGDIDGFVATRQKNLVRCDYIIDDRAYNLFNLHPETKGIHVETRYYDETLPLMDKVSQVSFDTLDSDLLELLKTF